MLPLKVSASGAPASTNSTPEISAPPHGIKETTGLRAPPAAIPPGLTLGRRTTQRCPWWPYVWSLRTGIEIDPDGRVPIGRQHLRGGLDPGARGIHCLHPDGAISLVAREPKPGERPALLLQSGDP